MIIKMMQKTSYNVMEEFQHHENAKNEERIKTKKNCYYTHNPH